MRHVAAGGYVAFVDADDFWEPGRIATQVDAMGRDPDIDLCFTAFQNFWMPEVRDEHRRVAARAELPFAAWSICTLLTRRDVFDRFGPFDEHLRKLPNMTWFLHAVGRGAHVTVLPEVLMQRRIRTERLAPARRALERRVPPDAEGVARLSPPGCPMTSPAPAPLISCIVAVYNGDPYLAEALESIHAQTYRPIEVLVVDDGSTDGTPGVIARHGDRVRALHQANAGPAAARNLGLREARGEFIAFLDADNLWAPTKLERQYHRSSDEPTSTCRSPWCRTSGPQTCATRKRTSVSIVSRSLCPDTARWRCSPGVRCSIASAASTRRGGTCTTPSGSHGSGRTA